MKPQPFAYVPARTLEEALGALAEHGEAARALAGGQSLVPVMALRLATPEVVVDLNGIAELDGVAATAEWVEVGALVRHRALERGAAGGGGLGRLLGRVAGHIGHVPVRVRGTFGGSIAHGDPAAEWCLVAVALGAEVVVAGAGGRRAVPAEAFLAGPFTTALGPGELVCSVRLPTRPGWRYGFCEHARTHGAFAQAGACVGLEVAGPRVVGARVAVMGASGRAERLGVVEEALAGAPVGRAGVLAGEATAGAVAPSGYEEVSAAYLRALLSTMVGRAVEDALATAGGGR